MFVRGLDGLVSHRLLPQESLCCQRPRYAGIRDSYLDSNLWMQLKRRLFGCIGSVSLCRMSGEVTFLIDLPQDHFDIFSFEVSSIVSKQSPEVVLPFAYLLEILRELADSSILLELVVAIGGRFLLVNNYVYLFK